MMTSFRLFILVVLLTASCKNPYYCPESSHRDCRFESFFPVYPLPCTDSAQCPAPLGLAVCDLGLGYCVECTTGSTGQASACSGRRPVCGTEDQCRACRSHAECPGSAACLPDGSCANASDVAYIAPSPAGTDNAVCSKDSPCTTVARALATAHPYLKFQGTTDEAVTVKDRTLIFLAEPGAMLTRTTNGNILVIDGASDVQISDLSINGASGSGAGILLTGGGRQVLTLRRVTMSGNNGTGGAITAFSGALNIYQGTLTSNNGTNGAITAFGGTLNIYQGTLTSNNGTNGAITAFGGTLSIYQSAITSNNGTNGAIIASGGTLNFYRSLITANTGGGISLSATSFDLENNIIARNGSAVAAYGGVRITQLGSGAHTLEFNTIAQNNATTGLTAGVACLMVDQPISFGNNIVYGNSGMQVSGANCAWTYSDIGPDPAPGAGNLSSDPLFVDAPQGNFHITGNSPVRDQANPDATLTIDIDGNDRPWEMGYDIGADEYVPERYSVAQPPSASMTAALGDLSVIR